MLIKHCKNSNDEMLNNLLEKNYNVNVNYVWDILNNTKKEKLYI